jgi:hypothetical protein
LLAPRYVTKIERLPQNNTPDHLLLCYQEIGDGISWFHTWGQIDLFVKDDGSVYINQMRVESPKAGEDIIPNFIRRPARVNKLLVIRDVIKYYLGQTGDELHQIKNVELGQLAGSNPHENGQAQPASTHNGGEEQAAKSGNDTPPEEYRKELIDIYRACVDWAHRPERPPKKIQDFLDERFGGFHVYSEKTFYKTYFPQAVELKLIKKEGRRYRPLHKSRQAAYDFINSLFSTGG